MREEAVIVPDRIRSCVALVFVEGAYREIYLHGSPELSMVTRDLFAKCEAVLSPSQMFVVAREEFTVVAGFRDPSVVTVGRPGRTTLIGIVSVDAHAHEEAVVGLSRFLNIAGLSEALKRATSEGDTREVLRDFLKPLFSSGKCEKRPTGVESTKPLVAWKGCGRQLQFLGATVVLLVALGFWWDVRRVLSQTHGAITQVRGELARLNRRLVLEKSGATATLGHQAAPPASRDQTNVPLRDAASPDRSDVADAQQQARTAGQSGRSDDGGNPLAGLLSASPRETALGSAYPRHPCGLPDLRRTPSHGVGFRFVCSVEDGGTQAFDLWNSGDTVTRDRSRAQPSARQRAERFTWGIPSSGYRFGVAVVFDHVVACFQLLNGDVVQRTCQTIPPARHLLER